MKKRRKNANFRRLPGPDISGICKMVLLLDLAEALHELRLLLFVTGRCYMVIDLFELPLVVDDLGRMAKIIEVEKKFILVLRRDENATLLQ